LIAKHAASEVRPTSRPAIGGPIERPILKHGVKRQGVGQVFAPPHEAVDQGLAQRRVEAVQNTQGQRHADQKAGVDPFRPGQHGQRETLQGEQALDADQPFLLVLLVDPGPGERPDKQLRNERAKCRDAEQGGRTSQPIDQPGQCDLLDPRADDRDGLAEEIEAKIAMPQGAQRTGQADGRMVLGHQAVMPWAKVGGRQPNRGRGLCNSFLLRARLCSPVFAGKKNPTPCGAGFKVPSLAMGQGGSNIASGGR
jgi:hypothetical protein